MKYREDNDTVLLFYQKRIEFNYQLKTLPKTIPKMLPGTFQRSGRVPEQSLHNTDVQKVYGRKQHEEKSFISNACDSNDSNFICRMRQ